MKITDAHTHLTKISDCDIVIYNSATPDDWGRIVNMVAESGGRAHGAIGVHPWCVSDLAQNWYCALKKILSENPDLLIGEIGIDKHHPNIVLQQDVFVLQLQLAHELQRGVSVHCVGAWDKVLGVLKMCRNALPPFILFHSYSGPVLEIEKLAQQYNAYFSYGVRSLQSPERILHTPQNRILIETDESDISVSEILYSMSEILSVAPEKMSDIIYENIIRMLSHAQITQN